MVNYFNLFFFRVILMNICVKQETLAFLNDSNEWSYHSRLVVGGIRQQSFKCRCYVYKKILFFLFPWAFIALALLFLADDLTRKPNLQTSIWKQNKRNCLYIIQLSKPFFFSYIRRINYIRDTSKFCPTHSFPLLYCLWSVFIEMLPESMVGNAKSSICIHLNTSELSIFVQCTSLNIHGQTVTKDRRVDVKQSSTSGGGGGSSSNNNDNRNCCYGTRTL